MSAQNFPGYVGSYINSRHSVQNMRTRPYPYIAADNSYGPYRGRLYNVYTSNNPSGNMNKPDIFLHYSDDGGATWSARTTVNDDLNSQNNHNFFPAVWCDKETGRLYLQWMDSRDTPTADSAMIYATYSDDGGQSFAPNQAVSNAKMKINCTQCPGSGAPKYQGDYNGVVSHKFGSVHSWTDFRNGTFANYVGFFPDFAVRAEPPVDTLVGNALYNVIIPSVKLYMDTVFVETTIDNAAGLFTISYPNGNKLWNFPGSVPVEITGIGSVPVGTYTVRFTASGSNGTPVHKRSALLKVFNFAAPIANFSASTDSAFFGQPFVFTDLSSGPATSWSWTFENGTPATSNQMNPSGIVYSTAGSHDVKLVISNILGTDSIVKSDYISVDAVVGAPVVTNLEMCQNSQSPILTAVGQNIRWYSNSNLTTQVGQGNSFTAPTANPGTYVFYVTQTIGACESPSSVSTLVIKSQPLFNLGANREVCMNNAITLTSTGAATSWQWNIGNFNTYNIVLDTSIANPGANQVICQATNAQGCSFTDTITITFVECIGFEEITAGVSAMIYPNPVKQKLQIKLNSTQEQNLTVTLMNQAGESLIPGQNIRFSGETSREFDLSAFANGVYLLRFETNGSVVTRQIVLMR